MSGKRNRDNDASIFSSKTIRNDNISSIRSDKFTSGGGGDGSDDGSDEEFIDFIVGKYNSHLRSQKEKDNKEENKELWEYVKINRKIDTIDDLIDIGKLYNEKEKKRYNINMVALNKLIEPLTDLKRMIGMPKLKKQI